MKKVLAVVLTTIAAALSTVASSGCAWLLLDEPEMFE